MCKKRVPKNEIGRCMRFVIPFHHRLIEKASMLSRYVEFLLEERYVTKCQKVSTGLNFIGSFKIIRPLIGWVYIYLSCTSIYLSNERPYEFVTPMREEQAAEAGCPTLGKFPQKLDFWGNFNLLGTLGKFWGNLMSRKFYAKSLTPEPKLPQSDWMFFCMTIRIVYRIRKYV